MDLDNLTLEDCMCSVCMCIFVEPVTMPCTHTLCMPCFKQNVEASSLTCPLCRKRISTWTRKAAREKTLINRKLWMRIQSMFPDKVEKRLDGEDQEDETEMNVFLPIINLAQPGEIRQEYEEQLKRLEKERELEQQREMEASAALIRQLEKERQVKSVDQQMIEEKDEELARELENIVNEAGTDSPFNIMLKESRNRLTRSRGSSTTSSKQSPLSIQSFIKRMRDAEKLKAADRSTSGACGESPYPYMCYTPSEKDQLSRPSTVTISSRSSGKSSTSCTSYNTDADIEWEIVTNNDAASSNEGKLFKVDRKAATTATCTVRSASAMSSDSINQELNHFKPIKICPVTPPKKNASGQIVETQVIRTTPRNLLRTDSMSPSTANSLSDIDAGSPVMRRRLSELEEERKSQVKQNSKATETSTSVVDRKNDIAKYFAKRSKASSPSENIPTLDKATYQPKVQLMKAFIPLEPTFDNAEDIHDFDDVMAPLMEINNMQTRTPLRQKPIKARHRNMSKHDDVSNNSILTPQRSIRDWLSGTLSPNSAIKMAYQDFNKHQSNCSNTSIMDMEEDSKKGILDSPLATQVGSNKLKLKSYPKRKHKAYHVSDYVYPKLSPKKRDRCIQISSDEEIPKDGMESDGDSIECPLLPFMKKPNFSTKNTHQSSGGRKRKRANVSKDVGPKKLKSVKLSKHQDKRVKTLQTFIKPKSKRRRVSGGSSHSGISGVSDMPLNVSVMSEKEVQEETDRRLALKLEKMFKIEAAVGSFSAIRIKGSDNEYSFRRKVKT